ncbi:hypothetical protein [Roseateles sp.]|uniref:hypothetical protein n=1 Tax=Roseateles sp. TaxID=1971397 RepID=UPI0039EB6D22
MVEAMQGKVDAVTKRLLRAGTLLEYRRLNWRVETMVRLSHGFAEFTQAARAAGFPMHSSVGVHDVPNCGLVTLSFGSLPTNALRRKHLSLFDEPEYEDQQILEGGGQLAASQSPDGHVFFISNPRSSDWMKPSDGEYFLSGPLDPTEITRPLIRKMIQKHLIVLRMSSMFGGPGSLTRLERCTFWWIVLGDIRKRHAFYRSLATLSNEWGKAVVAAVFAAVVGFVTASLAPSPVPKAAEAKQSAASASSR